MKEPLKSERFLPKPSSGRARASGRAFRNRRAAAAVESRQEPRPTAAGIFKQALKQPGRRPHYSGTGSSCARLPFSALAFGGPRLTLLPCTDDCSPTTDITQENIL